MKFYYSFFFFIAAVIQIIVSADFSAQHPGPFFFWQLSDNVGILQWWGECDGGSFPEQFLSPRAGGWANHTRRHKRVSVSTSRDSTNDVLQRTQHAPWLTRTLHSVPLSSCIFLFLSDSQCTKRHGHFRAFRCKLCEYRFFARPLILRSAVEGKLFITWRRRK